MLAIDGLLARIVRTAAVIGIAAGMTASPVDAALVLKLSTPKPSYLLGEQLFVIVTLRNTGSADAGFARGFEQWGTLLTFDITPPDGQRYRYVPTTVASGGSRYVKSTYLAPGETYSASYELTWDCRDAKLACVLAQSGEYVIQAEYRIPDEPAAVSNKLRLPVKEPKGIDRKVYDLLREIPRKHETNLWMAEKNTDALRIECYNKILQRYPKSGYTPHVAFFLACLHDVRHSVKRSETGVDEMGRAAELFELAAKKLGNSPLEPLSLSSAGWCYATSEKMAQAWAAFEAALTCPSTTDEDRLNTLSRMKYLPNRPRPEGPTDPHLHLDPVAKACGFAVKRDQAAGTVQVSGPRVECSFRPGANSIVINGVEMIGGMPSCIENGRVLVSPELITALIVEQHREHPPKTAPIPESSG